VVFTGCIRIADIAHGRYAAESGYDFAQDFETVAGKIGPLD
jgi:hypothetical protein